MNGTSTSSYGRYVSTGIFLTVCLCFAFIYYSFPTVADDWWYGSQILYLGADANGHHSLWLGLKECIKAHYTTDNARIANTVGAVFLVFPRWVSATCGSLAFVASYIMMIKLAAIKPDQWPKLCILTFLMVFGIMWEDHMFSIIFAFNYIIILPFFLLILYLFCNKNNVRTWVAILLGLIIGSWHESYGFAALAGCSFLIIIRPSFRTRWRFVLVSALFAGLIWHVLFPALYTRAQNDIRSDAVGLRSLLYLMPWIIVSVVYFRTRFFTNKERFKKNNLLVLTVVCGFALLPGVILTKIARAEFPTQVLSVCALTEIIFSYNHKRILKTRAFNIGCMTLLAITIIHLLAVCRETIFVRQSVNDLYEKAIANRYSDECVFYKAHPPKDYSLLSLYRPEREMLFDRLGDYTNNPDLRFVPEKLKNYREELGTPVKNADNIRIWNGYIISSNIEDFWLWEMWVEYGWWSEFRKVRKTIFKGADGKNYVYMDPFSSRLVRYLGNPTDVSRENKKR